MHQLSTNSISLMLITENRHNHYSLVQFLTDNGFDVTITSCEMGLAAIQQKGSFDLAVIDCASRADNGITLCKKLHKILPVIMIEGSDDEICTTAALNNGAYDYIARPVRQWELLARIKNILRRGKNTDILHYGNLSVDPVRGVVRRNGEEVFLSALEYRILLIFLANKDKVLTRQQLLDEIWNIGGDYVNDNTLTVYIKRIREKIEEDPAAPQTIKTVRGKGYKIGN